MLYNFKTSKQYLENLEKGWIKDKLEEVRNIILKYGPELEEAIEYKMLCYRLKEKTVFHLNAQKSYVSLYVGSIDKIQEGRHLLQNFNLGKGCIRVKKNNTINNSGLEDFIEKTIILYRDGENADC